ncbi:unnamed protein product [Candidula unifasciata]|uniref:Uncharacterized protein n=1 Tax=Candidula unifasciata TaxID=100452 RepID=A0A8S4A3B6_9EUPU|nr:unnamed protein product [Candidula unifasciata]
MIRIFQDTFNLDALTNDDAEWDSISTDGDRTDSILVCPPPTSGSVARRSFNSLGKKRELIQANAFCRCTSPEQGDDFTNCDDKKYILDPLYKERTMIGSHVNVDSLLKLRSIRGPDPLPARTPKRNPEMVVYHDADDERYYQNPTFMLDQFLYKFAKMKHMSIPQVRCAIYSKHNFQKLTNLIAAELNHGRQENLHTLAIDSSGIPVKENRIPQRQLLYEIAAAMKANMREVLKKEVKPVIKFSKKYTLEWYTRQQPDAEILVYEDDSRLKSSTDVRIRQKTELSAADAVFPSAHSDSHKGLRESESQKSDAEDELVTPAEMAVLDCLITGGAALSFKAYFIERLPDISPVMTTLTYLNLSFNNFKVVSPEVMYLSNLEVLKMRDNPLVEIPANINKLQKLRVLTASFSLITDLPRSLFDLPCLEELSLAYNKLTVMPHIMCHLKSLHTLDLEGNQITALPASCLHMEKLTQVNVRNNFMHPVFWKENNRNQAQSLLDLACVAVSKFRHLHNLQNVQSNISQILVREEVCDICKGPVFGPGLRAIRPMPKLFSIAYMPIMFRACTPHCLHHFKNMSKEELYALLYGDQASQV